MGDPLSTAASLIAVVTFGVKFSASLYLAIEGLKSRKSAIRQLKEEFCFFAQILEDLRQTIESSGTQDLDSLKTPLQRCLKACQRFETTVLQKLKGTEGHMSAVVDWAKLQIFEDEINDFRKTVASYKATIAIALAEHNLRTSKVTLKVLEEYKDLTENTAEDLKDRLEQLNMKLKNLQSNEKILIDNELPMRQQILEEKDGVKQCLDICERVLVQIENLQPIVSENVTVIPEGSGIPATDQDFDASARQITAKALGVCKEKLDKVTHQLQVIREERERKDSSSYTSGGAEASQVIDELESIQQCLQIVNLASEQAEKSRSNVYEDIKLAEETHQTIVSTIGELISARRITIGPRSTNVMGQMKDDSLQKITENYGPIKTSRTDGQVRHRHFEGKYGAGRVVSLPE